jgi:drug/metabolite transporter (DMT)-like permease
MKSLSATLLAVTTLANFLLAERLHSQMSWLLCAVLMVFSAAQGLSFVGLVQGPSGLSMARATVIYDVVVIFCWYSMVLLRGEGLGFTGRLGLALVTAGVLLVFK